LDGWTAGLLNGWVGLAMMLVEEPRAIHNHIMTLRSWAPRFCQTYISLPKWR
jgi:hypothetical protein